MKDKGYSYKSYKGVVEGDVFKRDQGKGYGTQDLRNNV